MSSIRARSFLVGLILLSFATSVYCDDYVDPSGFSFTYTEGWIPVNQTTLQDGHGLLSQDVKNWVTRNNMDLTRIKVMLIRKAPEEFLENLNVVVESQQLPVDDSAAKKMTGELTKKYEAAGIKVENLQCRTGKVGNRDVLVIDFQAQVPFQKYPLRQRQVMFPGGGNTYIVTCTAKVDSFDKYLPVFEKVLASFQVPAPVAKGINWNQVLTTAVIGGIVGGVSVGLLGLFKRLSRKEKPKKPKKRRDSTPDDDDDPS